MVVKIVSHDDLDGVISSWLLEKIHPTASLVFCKPEAIQQEEVDCTDAVVADLPKPKVCVEWFDHHYQNKPKSATPTDHWKATKSCARLIFETYPDTFRGNKIIETMIAAVDRVDSGEFDDIKNPNAANRISLALLTNKPVRDDGFRRFILNRLRAGDTFEQIAETQQVKEAFDNRIRKISSELEGTKLEFVMKFGTRFVIIREGKGFVSKAATFKVFSDYPKVDYIIKVRYADSDRPKIGITSNVYKNNNVVRIYAVLAQYHGGGSENTGTFTAPKEKVEDYIKNLIRHIATVKKIAEEK